MGGYAKTREMRFRQVERCLESGMQISEWCNLNKVPKSTLYFWLKAYREEGLREGKGGKEASNGGWIELTRSSVKESKALAVRKEAQDSDKTKQAKRQAADDAANNTIRVGINGADILIPAGCDSGTIESVLRAVAAL